MKKLFLFVCLITSLSSYADQIECANKEAREKMTAVVNYHRHSAGLEEVSEDDIFAQKIIINDEIITAHASFNNLSELKAHIISSSAIKEADQKFSESHAPASNMASWAMSYTINRLGYPSTKIEDVFCK